MDYDRAFAEVYVSRWSETPEEQKNAAISTSRRGQLKQDAPGSFALHDSYRYQRGHADVFREVYKKSFHSPPTEGERLLVVDIGAGAATVGVALGEALGRSERQRVDYVAFDPNHMMRKLGKRILKHLGAGFNSSEYVTALKDVDFTDADRLLFTLSYVVHQDTVTAADIEEWASLIKRAVTKVDQDVELIFTTAKRRKGAHHALRRMLSHANVLGDQHSIDVQVRQRFPEPADSDGQICWDEKNRLWKVRAEHWILSA